MVMTHGPEFAETLLKFSDLNVHKDDLGSV